jgi:hypothetical protein
MDKREKGGGYDEKEIVFIATSKSTMPLRS